MATARTTSVILGGLAMAPLLAALTAGPAFAAASAPPGNNGTVKVDGQPFDQGHDNEPHPGCTFRLTFFGFDAGANTADVTFSAQPPTGNTTLLHTSFSFTDTRDQGGATYDGASPTYDLTQALSGMTPSNQGYHVKLDVSVNGGNPKHKVFWVSGCSGSGTVAATSTKRATPAAARPAPAAAPAPVAPAPAAAAPAAVAPQVLGETITRQSPAAAVTPAPAQVMGETITRPAVAGTSASRGALAFTGFNIVLWSLAGAAAIAGGVAAVAYSRRSATS